MNLKIQIPSSHLIVFQEFGKMKFEEIELIAQFLKNIPIGIGIKTFTEEFSDKFPGEKSTEMAGVIFSLGYLKLTRQAQNTNDDLVESLTEAYKVQNVDANSSIPENLEKNISLLFGALDNLTASHKVFSLLNESGQIFTDARIISDIRLVFDEQLNEGARSALLLHQLKISSDENGNEKVMFFTLDSNDLDKIQNQIKRAKEKEQIIKEQYGEVFSFITVKD